MPLSESARSQPASFIPKVASLSAVVACYVLVEWISSFHLLSKHLPLPPSLSVHLAWLFEHHVWQFCFGMLAITVLSRGHLWSYGINSSAVRLSMSILLKFYVVALAIMAIFVTVPMLLNGVLPEYVLQMSRVDMIVWILFQWMATAVADEIFFHGLFQTLLLKYWKEKFVVKSFEFPIVILFTSVAFAAGRTNVPEYGNHFVEYIMALMIGLYGGLVYYRTRSLLTPMLSQAFFYGFPLIIRFIYFGAIGR